MAVNGVVHLTEDGRAHVGERKGPTGFFIDEAGGVV